jgi:hypothetical protein
VKVCPNNPTHKTFVTSATVIQDWLVDGEGNFIECVDDLVDVFHKPDVDNVWSCADCGAEAKAGGAK